MVGADVCLLNEPFQGWAWSGCVVFDVFINLFHSLLFHGSVVTVNSHNRTHILIRYILILIVSLCRIQCRRLLGCRRQRCFLSVCVSRLYRLFFHMPADSCPLKGIGSRRCLHLWLIGREAAFSRLSACGLIVAQPEAYEAPFMLLPCICRGLPCRIRC